MVFKIKKSRIKQLIKEEISKLVSEGEFDPVGQNGEAHPDDDIANMSVNDIASLVQMRKNEQAKLEKVTKSALFNLYMQLDKVANIIAQEEVARGGDPGKAQTIADNERKNIIRDVIGDLADLEHGKNVDLKSKFGDT